MKKFFSLLLALIATITVTAHDADRTMLKLRLSDRTPIAANVDGRYINRQTTSLTLDGLRPGMHRLEVYSTDGYRSRPVRIYTGTIRLEPGTVNIAMVDVYRRALRMHVRPIEDERDRVYSDKGDKESRDGSNDGDYNDRDDSKRDDVYGDNDNHRDPGTNSDRETGEGYGSFPRGRNNNADAGKAANNFSQRDMDDLNSRVGKRITDSDKESLMKTAVENRSVGTDQVREMLHWLSFESTRLDFAKWAYSRVTDRRNYWKLEDAFDFSASKKEFNDAIRER